jgi:hypothetical protein
MTNLIAGGDPFAPSPRKPLCRLRALALLGMAAMLLGACNRNVASDGYQARLARSVGDSVLVAARGDKTRVTERRDGQIWMTIRRPDLGKTWFVRLLGPRSDKVLESRMRASSFADFWTSTPPTTTFDIESYARQFQGSARRRDRLVFEQHPCEIWEVTYLDGRAERIWRATDLGGLPVRIQRGRLVPSDTRDGEKDLSVVQEVQLLEIRPGAPASFFDLPAGSTVVPVE